MDPFSPDEHGHLGFVESRLLPPSPERAVAFPSTEEQDARHRPRDSQRNAVPHPLARRSATRSPRASLATRSAKSSLAQRSVASSTHTFFCPSPHRSTDAVPSISVHSGTTGEVAHGPRAENVGLGLGIGAASTSCGVALLGVETDRHWEGPWSVHESTRSESGPDEPAARPTPLNATQRAQYRPVATHITGDREPAQLPPSPPPFTTLSLVTSPTTTFPHPSVTVVPPTMVQNMRSPTSHTPVRTMFWLGFIPGLWFCFFLGGWALGMRETEKVLPVYRHHVIDDGLVWQRRCRVAAGVCTVLVVVFVVTALIIIIRA